LRTSVGSTWATLSPDEQTRWLAAFSMYTINKFADQFDGYSGQSFELLGEKPASRNTLIIMSRLNRPSEEPVRLDFRFRKTADGWKVIDLYAKGRISEVAMRRSEYASILEREGIEGLIASVRGLAERTAAGADG
jgi:phospholipid transport system substrate-binding protein